MLNIMTLRGPRSFALAAALALAVALPGAGLVNSAHAAPAIPPTTLLTTFTGPSGSAAGAQGTYTLAVENSPFGATAVSAQFIFAIPKTDGSLLSFSAPGATCAVLPHPTYNAVICTAPSMVVGAEIDLSATVMFSGKTGVDNVLGIAGASNASTVSKTMQTTVVAQEIVPAQNPGYQLPYSGNGFGGNNA